MNGYGTMGPCGREGFRVLELAGMGITPRAYLRLRKKVHVDAYDPQNMGCTREKGKVTWKTHDRILPGCTREMGDGIFNHAHFHMYSQPRHSFVSMTPQSSLQIMGEINRVLQPQGLFFFCADANYFAYSLKIEQPYYFSVLEGQISAVFRPILLFYSSPLAKACPNAKNFVQQEEFGRVLSLFGVNAKKGLEESVNTLFKKFSDYCRPTTTFFAIAEKR